MTRTVGRDADQVFIEVMEPEREFGAAGRARTAHVDELNRDTPHFGLVQAAGEERGDEESENGGKRDTGKGGSHGMPRANGLRFKPQGCRPDGLAGPRGLGDAFRSPVGRLGGTPRRGGARQNIEIARALSTTTQVHSAVMAMMTSRRSAF